MLTHRYTFLLVQIVLLMLVSGTLAYAAADWRKQRPVRGPGGTVVATAVTPDGSRAGTVTADGHISLWDLPNRKLIRTTHLPEGKPIHLAIRNQGDAIAVAYENSDAVIWWCDGSDKVVRPSVDAKLVAFAHQKRILVTANMQIDTWDSHTGKHINGGPNKFTSVWYSVLRVLPSDNGAVVFTSDTVLSGSAGIPLNKPGRIDVEGSSRHNLLSDTVLKTLEGEVLTQQFDTAQITFKITDPNNQPLITEQGKTDIFQPVCVFNRPPRSTGGGWFSVQSYEATQRYKPVFSNQKLSDIITGNNAGDLIIHRRAQANDWIKHPAAWLVLPGFFLLGLVMLKRRWHRLEQPALAIDPVDASLDLPRQTIVAAWIMVIIGVLAVGDMIYGLFVDGFTLRIDALAILAGIRIRQRRNGWRKFAAFIAWLTMAGGALMLGAILIGQQLLEFSVGTHAQFLPIWLGSLFSLAFLGLGIFLFLALTNPRAQRICAAASSREITLRDQRLTDLTRCPSCGYNTTQTVLDGRRDCPECGMHIRYSPTEQGWVREHSERKA